MVKVNNNKNLGFTLVELLAVIVILGLIVGIAVFSIGGVLKGAKSNTKNISVNSLLDAARITTITDNVKLPAKFIIDSNGTIYLSSNSNIKLEYDKEKPVGGKIYIDQAGVISAVGVTFSDGYTCTMISGENGCHDTSEAKNKIIADQNNSDTYLKLDPNDGTRKVFAGSKELTPNRLMIKENGEDALYRIMAIEADGRIKVIRGSVIIFPKEEYEEYDYEYRSGVKSIDYDNYDVFEAYSDNCTYYACKPSTPTRNNDNNTYVQAIWTMNPKYNTTSEAWSLYGSGYMRSQNTSGYYYDGYVLPVFYLSPKTKLTGSGTDGSPYRIVTD